MISQSHCSAGRKTPACRVCWAETTECGPGVGNCYLKILKCFLFYLITSVCCSLFRSVISGQDIAICIWVHGVRLWDSLSRTLLKRNKTWAHVRALQSVPLKPRVGKKATDSEAHPSNSGKKAKLILSSTPGSSFMSAVCVLALVSEEGWDPELGIGQEKRHSSAPRATWQQDLFEVGVWVSLLPKRPAFVDFLVWIMIRSKLAYQKVQRWASRKESFQERAGAQTVFSVSFSLLRQERHTCEISLALWAVSDVLTWNIPT